MLVTKQISASIDLNATQVWKVGLVVSMMTEFSDFLGDGLAYPSKKATEAYNQGFLSFVFYFYLFMYFYYFKKKINCNK